MHQACKPFWHTASTALDWCDKMLAATLRSRSLHLSSSLLNHPWKPVLSGSGHTFSSSAVESNSDRSILDLNEIEKVLTDVRADDVKVIPAKKHAEWADYMVIATGRSTWHVKNIAQALIYKARSTLSCSLSLWLLRQLNWIILAIGIVFLVWYLQFGSWEDLGKEKEMNLSVSHWILGQCRRVCVYCCFVVLIDDGFFGV